MDPFRRLKYEIFLLTEFFSEQLNSNSTSEALGTFLNIYPRALRDTCNFRHPPPQVILINPQTCSLALLKRALLCSTAATGHG